MLKIITNTIGGLALLHWTDMFSCTTPINPSKTQQYLLHSCSIGRANQHSRVVHIKINLKYGDCMNSLLLTMNSWTNSIYAKEFWHRILGTCTLSLMYPYNPLAKEICFIKYTLGAKWINSNIKFKQQTCHALPYDRITYSLLCLVLVIVSPKYPSILLVSY